MSSRPWSVRCGASARGFTLVELMVGVSVALLLALLSAPSFLRQINSSRLAAAGSDLMGTLAQARGEAIRTGMRVTVCRSNDQSSCDTDASRDWNSGWIAFQDNDANGQRASSEPILLRTASLPSQILALGNQNVRDRISFRASGIASVDGTLRVCSTSSALDDAQRALDLIVIKTGRVVLQTASGVTSNCPRP